MKFLNLNQRTKGGRREWSKRKKTTRKMLLSPETGELDQYLWKRVMKKQRISEESNSVKPTQIERELSMRSLKKIALKGKLQVKRNQLKKSINLKRESKIARVKLTGTLRACSIKQTREALKQPSQQRKLTLRWTSSRSRKMERRKTL